MKKIIKEIREDQFYRPSVIAENGWINNSRGNKANYHFILGLIKDKKLSARNTCRVKNKEYYLVKGSDILKYIKNSWG